MCMTQEQCNQVKRRLEQLIREILTRVPGKSEAEEMLFRQHCAWQAERAIDEIENPRRQDGATARERYDEILISRERIFRRIRDRPENVWAEFDPHFGRVVAETVGTNK